MKKDGINIMVLGLIITIITVILYFTDLNGFIHDKFVITIGKSFHLNLAILTGIVIMAIGEFLLWESQHNKNLNEIRIKFLNKFKQRLSNVRLGLIYVIHIHLLNIKMVKFIVTIFHI